MTLLIIAIIALTFAAIIGSDTLKKTKEEKKELRKYEIPHTFWQDYNKCLFAIRDMKESNYEQVESKIDDFTYKYVELIEYKVFIEKISNLVSLYNNQVKSFLLNKHLN